MNRMGREAMIKRLSNHYVDDGSWGEPGRLMDEANFTELYKAVTQLKQYGRSNKWKLAISEWEDVINRAAKTFCDENGYSVVGPLPEWKTLPTQQQQSYTMLFKWAVLQGAIYAGYGA